MKENRKKTAALPDPAVSALQEKLQRGEPLASQMLAVSLAGHDKDICYVVLAEDEKYCYLADGKRRTLASPKKKKRIHLQPIIHLPEELLSQMQEIRLDAHLRTILKAYQDRSVSEQ